MSSLRNASVVVCIAVAHLFFLAQGAMLGCGFSNTVLDGVPDDMDHPNFYTCGCRCVVAVPLLARVGAAVDDAEQAPLRADDTDGAGDLDMGVVQVGLRFANLAVPQDATITRAEVQFTSDQAFAGDNTTPLTLVVNAEAADSAASFGNNFANLAARPRTAANLQWNVAPWGVTGQVDAAQRTPDIKAVVQEVISRPGWQVGNSLALFFNGSGGRREAESFDNGRAAILEVHYTAAPEQALNVCLPADLNPNLGNPIPTDETFQTDCVGRVQPTLNNLAMTCGYPSECFCTVDGEKPPRFNAGCNDPCVEVPLDPECANFDPVNGATTATNAADDEPVCVAQRVASGGTGPAGLAAAAFGMASECNVTGQATIDIGGETKVPGARGTIEILGSPCPGEECRVGVALDLMLDPIEFEVRFQSDPRFENLTATGASTTDAALIGPSGFGMLGAETTQSSLRGERQVIRDMMLITLTKAVEGANPDPVGVFVNWDDHMCALFGNAVAVVDDEGKQDLLAELTVQGRIDNEPPHADAGEDQVIECTSPEGATLVLDATGSSDPEGNEALFAWSEDTGAGTRLGYGLVLELQQSVGTATTAVLRVIDAFGQTDEDETTVAVQDTTAPDLSLSVSPSVLWTVNHKLVPVTVSIETTDVCDPDVEIRLVSIASNEGDLADGSGHTSPDVQEAAFGTEDGQFLLRAERSGTGDGRIYTITYEAEDASGNIAVGTTTVTVPKSQS